MKVALPVLGSRKTALSSLEWVAMPSSKDLPDPGIEPASPALAGCSLPLGFPGASDGKASACNVGDLGSSPGSRRSPGEGNGNPFQYSCLEISMD